MRIGNAIRDARGARSQEQLAADLGHRQGTISRWERGAETPDVESLTRIEAALGLRRGELLLAAGLVEPEGVEREILADPGLDPLSKSLLVETYRGFLREAERRRAVQ